MSVQKIDLNNLSNHRRPPKYSLQDRKEIKDFCVSPGPGVFDAIEPEKVKYSRAPQYAFGEQLGMLKPTKVPGPGAYDTNAAAALGEDTLPKWSLKNRLNEPKKPKRPGPGAYEPIPKSKSEPGIFYSMASRPSTTGSRKKQSTAPGPGDYTWVDPNGFGNGPKFGFRAAAKTESKTPKHPAPGEHNVNISTLGAHPSYKVGATYTIRTKINPKKPSKTCPDFPPLASTFT